MEYKYDHTKLSEIYSAIGEFVVKYQWVSMQARMLYVMLIRTDSGLRGMQLSEVLVYSKETADNTINECLNSAIFMSYHDKETREMASFLHKQFKIFIEKRNFIVHGHWWVGEHVAVMGSSTVDTHGFRRARGKDGIIVEPLPTVDELKKLSAQADGGLYRALVIFLTIAGDPEAIKRRWNRASK